MSLFWRINPLFDRTKHIWHSHSHPQNEGTNQRAIIRNLNERCVFFATTCTKCLSNSVLLLWKIQFCIYKGSVTRSNNYSIAFCFKGWNNHWICGACLNFFLFAVFFFYCSLWMNSNAAATFQFISFLFQFFFWRNILWMMWIPAGEFCHEIRNEDECSFSFSFFTKMGLPNNEYVFSFVGIDCRKKKMCHITSGTFNKMMNCPGATFYTHQLIRPVHRKIGIID